MCEYLYVKQEINQTIRRVTMADIHNHIETDDEREQGHVDTRERNFECENKDPHLGCDLGIDVAG
jgi:hypothetical protein